MLGRTVGLVAVSAVAAQALLLPPGVAQAQGDFELSPLNVDVNTQSIKLPCPECVSTAPTEKIESEEGDDMFWIQGGANSVLLNFTIGEDGTSMSLNGYTLYPPSVNFNKPTIEQVSSSASLVEIKESSNTQSVQVSSDSIFISEESVSPAGDAVIRVRYQLLQVDSHPVFVEGAEVTLLKGADDQLMILNVEPVPKAKSIFDSLPHPAKEQAAKPFKECSMLPAFMCEWKNVAENKMEELKASMPKIKGGCHGKKLPGHLKGPKFDQAGNNADGRPHHHHGRPPKPGMRPHHGPRGPHGHHGGHHGHRHHMHFVHKFLSGLFMVLIPVMAGITVGMTVSLIGMLVGRLIAFCWIKFARGGRRGYASVAQQESEAEAEAGEKTEYVVEEAESLPRYEEAPAYEEAEQK